QAFDEVAEHYRRRFRHVLPRSRGDRDELFGGFGHSWRGAFVGGELLVKAVTTGPPGERPPGNFPDYHLMP
ncbi:aldehyde dehydrogenase, partial [Streptomyces niveus]